MFTPLFPTLISGRFVAELFRSRLLTSICFVSLLVFGGFATALAQDKPADSQPSASTATGQTSSSDLADSGSSP